MSRPRIARCACGQLGIACRGDPALVSVCHCLDCQRRTGSAFGVAAFYRRDQVEATGRESLTTRAGGSGHPLTFHFCPDCGTTLYWEPGRRPELVAVALGAFADPGFPPPSQAVFEHRRHPWVAVDAAPKA